MDKENPKKLPKYINTGDTAVYKKGEHLFAYFESARQAAAVRTMNKFLRMMEIASCVFGVMVKIP